MNKPIHEMDKNELLKAMSDSIPTNEQIADAERQKLRDWFAGMAMQGLIAMYAAQSKSADEHSLAEDVDLAGWDGNRYFERTYAQVLSTDAYTIADAMLKARENGGGE